MEKSILRYGSSIQGSSLFPAFQLFIGGWRVIFYLFSQGGACIIDRFCPFVRIPCFPAATTWWVGQWVAGCTGCLLVVLFWLVLFGARHYFAHISCSQLPR
jgi:hypothetical protein